MESSVNAKGQVTIPQTALAHLGLKSGDRLRFFVRPDGGVVLLPALPASALRELVAPRESSVTIEEMTEAIAAGAIVGGGFG